MMLYLVVENAPYYHNSLLPGRPLFQSSLRDLSHNLSTLCYKVIESIPRSTYLQSTQRQQIRFLGPENSVIHE